MASIEDYKEFGVTLVGYVNASASSSELQASFKEGGALHAALKSLNAQEADLDIYQKELLGAFNPGQEGSLTQEQVNAQSKKNDDVRKEIVNLRARLNELSQSIGSSNNLWTRSKAANEFVQGVSSGQKVESNFLSTLFNAIKNAFIVTSKEKLGQVKAILGAVTNSLSDKKSDRVTIPEKKRSKEVKKEVEKSKEAEVKPSLQAYPAVEAPAVKAPSPEVASVSPPAPPLEPPVQTQQPKPEVTVKKAPGIMDLAGELKAKADARNKGAEQVSPDVEALSPEAASVPPPPPPPAPPLEPPVQTQQPKPEVTVKKAPGIMDLAGELKAKADARNKGAEQASPDVEVPSPEAASMPPPPPPPPGPPPQLSGSKKTSPEVVAAKKPAASEGLLEQIRRKGKGQKKEEISKDHMNDKGERDFMYQKAEQPKEVSSSGIMGSALKAKIALKDQVNLNNVLDGKSMEEQKNMLYSAMIDKNQEFIESFIAHKTEYETGELDDWDSPIMEKRNTFSSEDISMVEKAIIETNERIEKGKNLPSLEAKKATEIKEDPDVSKPFSPPAHEAGVASIPPAPPAPPAPTFTPPKAVGKAKIPVKPKVDTPKALETNRAGLLDQIKNAKASSLKSKGGNGLDMDGLTYIKSEKSGKDNMMQAAMMARRGGVVGNPLKDMPEKKQLDTLYTAIIDDNQEKIQQISKGGKKKIFTSEAVTKICEAAVKIAANQSGKDKIITEKSIEKAAKEFKVEVSVNQPKSQGR